MHFLKVFMALIYETNNFIVESFEKPHVDRDDGGHIRIMPKVRVLDRQHISPSLAVELMKLTVIVGEAMTIAMNRRGVDVSRINYQDNGNWSVFKPEGPYLHYHLYGRAKSAKHQKYGDAIYSPHRETHPEHYANLKPLNDGDIKEIRKEIEKLSKSEKYNDKEWHI